MLGLDGVEVSGALAGTFTAEVLGENRGMQKVFNQSGLRKRTKTSGGVISYEMDF